MKEKLAVVVIVSAAAAPWLLSNDCEELLLSWLMCGSPPIPVLCVSEELDDPAGDLSGDGSLLPRWPVEELKEAQSCDGAVRCQAH